MAIRIKIKLIEVWGLQIQFEILPTDLLIGFQWLEVERAMARLEFWLEPAELEPARLARARHSDPNPLARLAQARKFLIWFWLGSLELGSWKWLARLVWRAKKRAKVKPKIKLDLARFWTQAQLIIHNDFIEIIEIYFYSLLLLCNVNLIHEG